MLEHTDLPLLSLLLLTLPIGALLVWLVRDPRQARWIALSTLVVDLVLAFVVVIAFRPGRRRIPACWKRRAGFPP